MRKILCLAFVLMMGALLLSAGSRPTVGCTDYDNDGVCAGVDCDDVNPFKSYNQDLDNDGVTECQGDCADDDPTITRCSESKKRYPLIVYPEEQGCTDGWEVFRVHLRNCVDNPDGTGYSCDVVGESTVYFEGNCYF